VHLVVVLVEIIVLHHINLHLVVLVLALLVMFQVLKVQETLEDIHHQKEILVEIILHQVSMVLVVVEVPVLLEKGLQETLHRAIMVVMVVMEFRY